jgi:hypothetical protein
LHTSEVAAMKASVLTILICAFASSAAGQQYHRVILPGYVNSERDELLPVWSPGGDTLFFLTDRKIDSRPWLNRIWFSRYENGLFDTPRVYDEIKYNHEVGGMARDYLGNIFIASSMGTGTYSSYLYDVSRFDGKYRDRVLIGESSIYRWDGDPSVTADGEHLYFASFDTRKENVEYAIFVSHKQKDGSWGLPINVGDNVNGMLSNRMPSISPSGRTLYFTRIGTKSFQLYKSVKTGPADTDWSVAEPLAPPFNEKDWGTSCFAPHPSGLFVIICSWNYLSETRFDLYRVNIGK